MTFPHSGYCYSGAAWALGPRRGSLAPLHPGSRRRYCCDKAFARGFRGSRRRRRSFLCGSRHVVGDGRHGTHCHGPLRSAAGLLQTGNEARCSWDSEDNP